MRAISCGLFGLAPNMEQDLTGTMKALKRFGFSAVEPLVDRFLAASDDCVKLQLDTGWQMYAGEEVLPFMEKYAGRIQSVHLKDFAPDYKEKRRDEAFAATGFGVLPVREILARLPAIDLIDCGLMIDQDGATIGCFLMEDLEKGMAFLRSTEDAD